MTAMPDTGIAGGGASAVPADGLLDRRAAVAAAWRVWRPALLVLAVGCAIVGVVFWPSIEPAVKVWWNDRSYNHCLLIPLVSAYVVWDRREVLLTIAPRAELWAALLALPLGAAFLAGKLLNVLELQQFAIVAILQVMAFATIGRHAYRALLFPLLYLFFMVPSGQFLVAPLQDFTAQFVVGGLRLIGIPVYLDGIFISIPNGLFEVAEACAGLRFLIACIAFGFLFANLMYRSTAGRLGFIAASIVVPIVANGFRALGIVLIAHYSNNKLAVDVDHLIYGWVFFTMVIALLVWIGMLLRDPDADDLPPLAARVPPPPAASGSTVAAALATLLAAGAGPAYAAYVDAQVPLFDAARLTAPAAGGGWRTVAGAADEWQPQFVGADAEVRETYAGPAGEVELYIAYYAWQRYMAKVVSFENRTADGDRWQRIESGTAVAEIEGRKVPVRVEVMRGSRGERRLAWRFYWASGHTTGSTLEVKLRLAEADFLLADRGAAAIVVATDVAEDRAVAAARLQAFLSAMAPLGPLLGAIPDQPR